MPQLRVAPLCWGAEGDDSMQNDSMQNISLKHHLVLAVLARTLALVSSVLASA